MPELTREQVEKFQPSGGTLHIYISTINNYHITATTTRTPLAKDSSTEGQVRQPNRNTVSYLY